MTTSDAYLTELATLLPSRTRETALADLRAAFAEGLDPADLPAPAQYAAEILGGDPTDLASDAPDPAPQGHILGVPVDVRGLTNTRVLARTFDPTNPAILVPRTLGVGWDINMGAVAVKLGLLRPDDVDADVISAIPSGARTAVRLLPAALAAVTTGAVVHALRTNDAARLPNAFGTNGRPKSVAGRRATAAGLIAGSAAVAVWGATAPADNPMRPALACGLATLPAGQALLLSRWAARPDAAQPVLAVAASLRPALGTLGAAVLPIRAGLRRVATTPTDTP